MAKLVQGDVCQGDILLQLRSSRDPPAELLGKDQRIVGMEILRNMKPDGDEWTGGEILDPETGKTYKAKMKLADDGKNLVVRGYIGFSLFGRSQTWVRRQ